jgi:hypothetical protein
LYLTHGPRSPAGKAVKVDKSKLMQCLLPGAVSTALRKYLWGTSNIEAACAIALSLDPFAIAGYQPLAREEASSPAPFSGGEADPAGASLDESGAAESRAAESSAAESCEVKSGAADAEPMQSTTDPSAWGAVTSPSAAHLSSESTHGGAKAFAPPTVVDAVMEE